MQTIFYTIPEIALMFKVDSQTVMNIIKRKELSAVKFGRQWRIDQEAISEYQKRRTVKAKKQLT